METIGAIAFFAFGTIIGSFLNVVIFRYNTGKTLWGRSRCFACGRIISWYDLIPVVSFILLRARCRFCKSKFSLEYPLVEAVTGFLFLSVFLKFIKEFGFDYSLTLAGFLWLTDVLTVISLLIIIAAYDLKHKIIPDLFAFLFGTVSFIYLFLPKFSATPFHFPGIIDLSAGPILALPIFLLWVVSRGRWIGLGDAKLALGIGWFLSLALGVSAVIIGFWLGALAGLLGIATGKLPRFAILRKLLLNFGLKNLTMVSELPLAPFLIAGLLIVFFSNWDVVGLASLFNF